MSSISEIIRLLNSCASKHEINDPEQLYASDIAKIIQDAPLVSLLEDIRTHILASEHSTGASLLHENGFSKISLYKHPETSLQVRLHIWPEEERLTNYHNHRWNFLSFLLGGELIVHNWERIPTEDGQYEAYQLYDADAQLSKNKESIGRCNLLCSSSYRLSPKGYHFANSYQMHSAMSTIPSLSLMITGTSTRDYSDVIFLTSDRANTLRKELTKQQILSLIDNLIAHQRWRHE